MKIPFVCRRYVRSLVNCKELCLVADNKTQFYGEIMRSCAPPDGSKVILQFHWRSDISSDSCMHPEMQLKKLLPESHYFIHYHKNSNDISC